ncbi:cysteine desulfurase [Paenibacillus darwinianus]|uniref:cysteine desulfurase n=1 Tax=Paenibacillus darwinianus TaxID=1380763 RepID=A0A9W5S0U0_9BACL|nr:cysteine desulfurase family protein [Paenibacillus darwinianus]EXX87096.1 cysteine desulfurase [Paenibacillus darwinianus]EXX88587.1 cysteine desulfurase [Paenibacillus darwinianus]EXX88715.1 cysteine desulfurase [Paenibacillus darwinianus]
MTRIYLDHAATTPLHPLVAEAMLAVMQGGPGNASSVHAYGRAAKERLSAARDGIADRLGCKPAEFMFTSGGTESDNSAMIGSVRALAKRGKRHIVISAVEHHAVLHTAAALEREGCSVTVLPVDETGAIELSTVEAALTPETALISIMWGNNEVGTLQPVEAIGELARRCGVLYHVDAVQALGFLPMKLSRLPVDLMSFSAHKINGPQGVGGLYVASGTPFEPYLHGGSQERKRRAGTENVAGITGFAKAIELATADGGSRTAAVRSLRDGFESQLIELLGPQRAVVNGDPANRLPHISNISLIGADTETLLMRLDLEGIAAASGSACTSGALERSHVLQAMGLSEDRLASAVRFSFGLGNTAEEIAAAAQKVATVAERIRNNS